MALLNYSIIVISAGADKPRSIAQLRPRRGIEAIEIFRLADSTFSTILPAI